jgi:hypothetical protein
MDPNMNTPTRNTLMLIVALVTLILLTLTFTSQSEAADLHVEQSLPGESIDVFVARIANKATFKTKMHQAEVCGGIYAITQGYVMHLKTDYKPNSCIIFPQYNMIYTFHTHVEISGNATFGAGDYAAPGYLAIGNKLLFQNGRGTERRIK